MNDIMTVTGIVGREPDHSVSSSGVAVTSFRLASRERRRTENGWVDGETNWYTVTAFRHLAYNLARSIHKGDHVLVTGRLEVRDWEKNERRGTSVEIMADAVGHDLFWYTTTPVRSGPTPASGTTATASAPEPQEAPQPTAGWADPHLDSRPLGSDRFMPIGEGEVRELADVDS